MESAVKTVSQSSDPPTVPTTPSNAKPRAAYLVDLEKQMSEQLSTKVQIKTARKKGAGTLSIDFYSIDQFDELLNKLGVEPQ